MTPTSSQKPNKKLLILRKVSIMNLEKTLKRKFYLKQFTLILLTLLYIPVIGLIVTQFIYKEYFIHIFIIFIVMFVITMILILIFEKVYALPPINNMQDLTIYLKYFSSSKISDLEYTETITWFSHKIHSTYIQKAETENTFTDTINKLYLILRPQNNDRLSIAFKHKKSFIKLSQELCNSSDMIKILDDNIFTISNEKPEQYKFIKITLDKNILFYLFLFLIHTFGCFLLVKSENNNFDITAFIANLCLCIPTDLLLILVYTGFIKETRN